MVEDPIIVLLEARRQELGQSQAVFAKAIDLDPATYTKIKSGTHKIPARTFPKIAQVLDISEEEIRERTNTLNVGDLRFLLMLAETTGRPIPTSKIRRLLVNRTTSEDLQRAMEAVQILQEAPR